MIDASRRRLLRNAALTLAAAAGVPALVRAQARGAGTQTPSKAPAKPAAPAVKPKLEVYKDPQCGCCSSWVDHMKANGYAANVTNANTDVVKRAHKIPAELQSCHTTLVAGYVIEGHVPASDIAKLLAQKPTHIRGLTIPGMPKSAPGMDLLPFEPYTVLSFDATGKTAVFAKHDKP